MRYCLADEPIDQIALEMHAPADGQVLALTRSLPAGCCLGVDDHGDVTAHE